ncbi:MAG TPA: glycosyltransferase [Thermoanaerobaculia bacterium]|jgi:glycosyltransferase involved in cell wall biosynthesis
MTAAVDEQTTAAPPPRTTPHVRSAIAVVVSHFPRLAETYILREIDELERHGQPVVLVPLIRARGKVMHEEAKPWLRRALYTPHVSLPMLLVNFVRMWRHPRRYFGTLLRLLAGTAVNPTALVRALLLFPKAVYLSRVLATRGIRHVHAHFATEPATAAWIISSISDITYSFSIHGPDVFVDRLLMPEKLANATFVRTISTFNKAFVGGLYPAVSQNKIEVVHAGVNPEVYEKAKSEAAAEGGPRKLRIFSAAQLSDTKAFPLLVDACGRLKKAGLEFECLIAGEGPQRIDIEEAIRTHDVADSVRLLGPTPQHEVARLIGESDLFVLPSVIAYSGQMDGIPVALMEAMAAGLPVIAPAISGIPELIDHNRSGLLIDVTQPEQLARAMRQLLENRELRERIGRAAKERVRDGFDVRRTAAELVSLLDAHHGPKSGRSLAQLVAIDWGSLDHYAMGVRRVQERRDSFVAEVTITDGIRKREVVVKKHPEIEGDGRDGATRAGEEFDALKRLRDRLLELDRETTGNVIYAVPKALVLDRRHAALVMERAPGRSLETMIRTARNRGFAHRRLALPLRRTGTWLRLMQRVTASDEDGRHILTAVVILALRDLELAAAANRTIRRNREAIASTLRTLETRVAAQPLPVVGHHGDFWSGNVFIGDRRVDVIDFEGFRDGLGLEDVAYFCVHLELYFVYPFFRRYAPKLVRSFLEGYAGDGTIDPEALRLFTLAKGLQVLARGGGEERGHLRAMWRRQALERVILRGLA